MEEDNPASLAHAVLTQGFWRGHPLGSPILGTAHTVRHFSRPAVVDCFRTWYAANNTIIAAAGHIEMRRLMDLVERTFGSLKPRRQPAAERSRAAKAPEPHARLITRDKPALEQ